MVKKIDYHIKSHCSPKELSTQFLVNYYWLCMWFKALQDVRQLNTQKETSQLAIQVRHS